MQPMLPQFNSPLTMFTTNNKYHAIVKSGSWISPDYYYYCHYYYRHTAQTIGRYPTPRFPMRPANPCFPAQAVPGYCSLPNHQTALPEHNGTPTPGKPAANGAVRNCTALYQLYTLAIPWQYGKGVYGVIPVGRCCGVALTTAGRYDGMVI